MGLFLLLWPIALLPKIVQLFVLGAMTVVTLWQCKSLSIDKWAKLLFAYIGVNTFSVCYNLVTEQHELSRVMAAINMLLIWIVAVLIYIYYQNAQINLIRIGCCCFINIVIMIALAIWHLILVKEQIIYLLPYTNHVLFYCEEKPRFQGLQEYPTLVSAWILIQIIPACYFLWTKTKTKIIPILFYIMSFMPVYYSYSRNGYVLFFVATLVVIFIWIKKKFGLQTIAALGVGSLAVLVICWNAFYSRISEILNNLFGMRSGSNDIRGRVYEWTWQRAMESPIWGKGIKDICPEGLPYGSHCSYLGFFYKTGIIGLAIILLAFIGIGCHIWFRGKQSMMYWTFATFISCFFAFCIFEDIDGANWLICVFFALLGIQTNPNIVWQKEKVAEERKQK